MKRILILTTILIISCSSDSEGNPCIYEPTLTTEAATDITETSATLNGVISIVSENCDVPNNTEQGFVYSTEIQPTLEDIQVNVNGTNISTTIEGLTPNTTYYVRAFLTNSIGEFYGNEIEFTTNLLCDNLSYVEGVQIGELIWSNKNVDYTTYCDGTEIPYVENYDEWRNLTTGAWTYPKNPQGGCGESFTEEQLQTLGKLYNYYAVKGIHDNDPNTPNKEFAPTGWRVASKDDWSYLFENTSQEGRLTTGTLESGNGLWCQDANPSYWVEGTNSTGFNGLAGGWRITNSAIDGYNQAGVFAYNWTSTEGDGDSLWIALYSNRTSYNWAGVVGETGSENPTLGGNWSPKFGLNVRLVKD